MIILFQIKPISELKDNIEEVENSVINNNETIYLTKDGYGVMAIMSLEQYSKITEQTENKGTSFNMGLENKKSDSKIEIISRPRRMAEEDD